MPLLVQPKQYGVIFTFQLQNLNDETKATISSRSVFIESLSQFQALVKEFDDFTAKVLLENIKPLEPTS